MTHMIQPGTGVGGRHLNLSSPYNDSILYLHKSHNTPILPPKILHNHCLQFLLGHVGLDNFYLLRFWWLLLQLLRAPLLASNFFCSNFTLLRSCLFSLWTSLQWRVHPVLEERGFTGRVISRGSPSARLSMDSAISAGWTVSSCGTAFSLMISLGHVSPCCLQRLFESLKIDNKTYSRFCLRQNYCWFWTNWAEAKASKFNTPKKYSHLSLRAFSLRSLLRVCMNCGINTNPEFVHF